MVVPYSGKLSTEKNLANFKVLGLFAKVFSLKFGGVMSFGSTNDQSEIFLREYLFSLIRDAL